jgi:hypothetical protein
MAFVQPWSFSATYSASSVKMWHPSRTGWEKGSETGRGRGKEKGGGKLQ